MVTRETNQQLTQTGPGTVGGRLFRAYWHPVALLEEMPDGGPPRAIRILGEDLVIFRDETGQLGLMNRRCPHRGTDLAYGRIEAGGLRCLYHGWVYDTSGQCLMQPTEPAGSQYYKRIKNRAYPCQELGGFVFAFMGDGTPPELPRYEALRAPAEHRFSMKLYQRCNYLQGLEGEIDPVHTSFLHRYLRDPANHSNRRLAKGYHPHDLFAEDAQPRLWFERTDYGLRIFAERQVAEAERYLRVSNYIFPHLAAVPGATGEDGYTLTWHIPVDDTQHWRFEVTFRRSEPLDLERFGAAYKRELDEDYKLRRSPENRYGQDREQMIDEWFSGMDNLFPVHDVFATESQGVIQDRTAEHLGQSDKALTAARKMLLRGMDAIEADEVPPNSTRDREASQYRDVVVLSELMESDLTPEELVKTRLSDVRF